MELKSLKDLLEEQIKDLYSAEKMMVKALPKMAAASSSEELKEAFITHESQTKEQIRRLEKVAKIIGFDPEGKKCAAMEGLIKEGEEMLKTKGEPSVIDAGLIAAAQRVEHYEIAAYGTVAAFAERLDYPEAVALLRETLQEESDTDEELTEIAESSVNIDAEGEEDEDEATVND